MSSKDRSFHVMPKVAEFEALLHSIGRDVFEAAIEDFIAAPRSGGGRSTQERRKHRRPVSIDRRGSSFAQAKSH